MLDQRIGIRGRRVLEVGCGPGRLALELASRYGLQVVGVLAALHEAGEGFVALGARRDADRVQTLLAEWESKASSPPRPS
jgi:cyclopropane fatty-acyl-phospholipid synthase-like methyltransferase